MTLVTNSRVWTLLDIVNHILNSTDSELVDSISDTTESEQVAEVIKGTFYNIVSNKNWEGHRTAFQLSSYGDSSKPTHMKLPNSIREVLVVNYNKRKLSDTTDRYQSCSYLRPDEFLKMTNSSSGSDNTITVVDPSGISLTIKDNVAPSYYTSFDDETIVFDSYDSELEATLIAAKTQCMGYTHPHFVLEDSYVPDLPEDAMMYLIEDSKSTASLVLRQMADEKAEQRSNKQRRWLSRKSWRVNGAVKTPDYGRRSGAYTRSPHFPPKR